MEILGRLALDEQRVRANLQDPLHGQHIGHHDVLESRHESLIAAQLFVPPTIGSRELGADEHLVDGRVELNPGKAAREVFGVSGEKIREIWILKVADPVRDAEVAEIDDGDDIAAQDLGEGHVREGPVVTARTDEGLVEWWTVAQDLDVELVQKLEIRP